MNYIEKNTGLVTAHKLLDFERCPWCFEKKYIDLIPDPTTDDKDYFILGQAFDTLVSEGQKEFEKKYEVVKRRNGEAEKIQLTEGMSETLDNMGKEFLQNQLFHKQYKKKVFQCEISGLKLSGELDHFDEKERLIIDLKSCANIQTFDAYAYTFQMAFYQFLVEESTGVRCRARLNVVDKYAYFSRSRCYEFGEQTLFAERGRILRLLEQYKVASDTGIFLPSKDQETLEGCPYYGIESHGRTKEIIYI